MSLTWSSYLTIPSVASFMHVSLSLHFDIFIIMWVFQYLKIKSPHLYFDLFHKNEQESLHDGNCHIEGLDELNFTRLTHTADMP